MKNIITRYFTHLTKLEIIVGLYIFFLMASETMGMKLIHLFDIGDLQLNTSVAIFALPFIFSINDIIIEVYGINRARALTRLGFFIIVLIALFCIFFTALPSSPKFASMHDSYNAVFSFSIRVSIASLTAFAVAQFTDIWIFKKIRTRFGKKALWFRNNVSNIIGLLIDTTIFMLIARYDTSTDLASNIPFLIGLILPYWLIKCFMSALITPFTYLGVKWLRTPSAKTNP